MTQSRGNTYWKLLSPFYNHKMTSLSLKSWHPETLKPQTINDTWVFLSLYFTVSLLINFRAQILQVRGLEHVEKIKTSLLRKC